MTSQFACLSDTHSWSLISGLRLKQWLQSAFIQPQECHGAWPWFRDRVWGCWNLRSDWTDILLSLLLSHVIAIAMSLDLCVH